RQPRTFSLPTFFPSRSITISHRTPSHFSRNHNGHSTMNGSTMMKKMKSRKSMPVSHGTVFHHQRRTDHCTPFGSVTSGTLPTFAETDDWQHKCEWRAA